ncbi:MAG TPA: HAMP domain-containing sensor histidine kinase [Humibacter sp.]|nr:HAMP domain-containing sensor histidine kinase [Humibacter sp.]
MNRPAETRRSSDGAAIRRASRIISWQITIAAAVIVLVVVLVTIAVIIDQQQPRELLEKPRPGESRIYVDASQVLVVLIVLGVIAIAIAGLLSWSIARRAVRPLGDALRMQRTFVADAGHELRTPLAVLDARIQALQRRLPADDPTTTDLVRIRADTRVLIDVVGDLLLAADPDVASPAEPSRVAAVVAETVDAVRLLAVQQSVSIVVQASTDARVAVPGTSLRRCLVALLDNAVAWSPPGSTITVSVRQGRQRVVIDVADQGHGIHGIDPSRVFERFAHATGSDAAPRQRPGFGIGLALVRDIAVRHGGSVEVTRTGPTGTTFTLTLPAV